MLRVLEMLRESGANAQEAISALEAAKAMLPEIELRPKPTMTIQT